MTILFANPCGAFPPPLSRNSWVPLLLRNKVKGTHLKYARCATLPFGILRSCTKYRQTTFSRLVIVKTLPNNMHWNYWKSKNTCRAWFFSGRNWPMDNTKCGAKSWCSWRLNGSFKKPLMSHGGYTLWVAFAFLHRCWMWSLVQDEFTMTDSAQRPAKPYM